MSWSFQICDTRTGVRKLEVFPSDGRWSRRLNNSASGSHTFQLGDRLLTRHQWWDLTTPWSRTLVVSWIDGTVETAVYAGVITSTNYSWDKKTLQVDHVDLRDLFKNRYPFGVGSYWSDGTETKPGKLVCTNLSFRAIASRLVYEGANGPFPFYSLPIVLPSMTEAGPFSETYENWRFVTVYEALDDLQNRAGGPDIDFDPQWTGANGSLQWIMQVGVPTQYSSQLVGETFELNLTAADHGASSYGLARNGMKQLTGVFAIGEGTEEDMLVGGDGLDVSDIPALDATQSFKGVDSKPVLASYSAATTAVLKDPILQTNFSLRADSWPGAARLKLASMFHIYSAGDEYLPDGYTDVRMIGISGDMTYQLVPVLQPVGGA